MNSVTRAAFLDELEKIARITAGGIDTAGILRAPPPPLAARAFPKNVADFAPQKTHPPALMDRVKSFVGVNPIERGGGTRGANMGSAQRKVPYQPQVMQQKDPFAGG